MSWQTTLRTHPMIVKSTTVRSEFEGVWPIPKCRTCLDRSMFQVQTPRPVFFMLNSTVPRLVELVGFLLKQKPNAMNSPIFHVGVPTLDPTDRGNPRKFPPFHSVEKPIPRTLTMFCAFSEWFQGSSFQKNHAFWPPNEYRIPVISPSYHTNHPWTLLFI